MHGRSDTLTPSTSMNERCDLHTFDLVYCKGRLGSIVVVYIDGCLSILWICRKPEGLCMDTASQSYNPIRKITEHAVIFCVYTFAIHFAWIHVWS